MNRKRKKQTDQELNSSIHCTSPVDENFDVDGDDDDDLPEALTLVTKSEFKQGDLLFAKFKRYPYWPAVFYKYVARKRKSKQQQQACVHFFEDVTEYSKRTVLKVPTKQIKLFTCQERETLIQIGNTNKSYARGLHRANEYLRKKALGKISDFFTDVEEEESDNESDGNETLPEIFPDSPAKKSKESPLKVTPLKSTRKSKRQASSHCKEISTWIKTFGKALLIDIYLGHQTSERHQTFTTGSQHAKGQLKWMSGFGPFDEDEYEYIFALLLSWYDEKFKNSAAFNSSTYVSEVWLPEAIIHGLAATKKVSIEDAEKEYLK